MSGIVKGKVFVVQTKSRFAAAKAGQIDAREIIAQSGFHLNHVTVIVG
jgi:hypothetical protein